MIGMGSISYASELYVGALASKALAKSSPNVAPLQFIGMWPLSANRYSSRTAVNSSREVKNRLFWRRAELHQRWPFLRAGNPKPRL